MAAPVSERFRLRAATMDDLPAVVDVMNAHTLAAIGIREATPERVRNEWTSPEFDMGDSTCLVTTPDGRVVAYAAVWDLQEPLVRAWVDTYFHPDFHTPEIGTQVLEWAETRAMQSLHRVPEGARYIMLSSDAHTYDPGLRLFQSYGMEHIRTFWEMRIQLTGDIPAPVWPEGITVRTMTPGKEERAYIGAFREAFRDHWGFVDEPLDKVMEHWQHIMDTESDFDPTLWFMALDGDEIAGIALCWPKADDEPEVGWINILGVRRPWRKRGLGLALLRHAFREFQARGRTAAGLGVDSSNLTGATRLYEAAGMYVHHQFHTYCKVLRPGFDMMTPKVED